MAEKIDNSIKAIINMEKDETFSGLIKVCIMLDDAGSCYFGFDNVVGWECVSVSVSVSVLLKGI